MVEHVRLNLQHMHGATRDLRNEAVRSRHDDARAFPVYDLDNARTLERLQRFADCWPAYAIDLHHFPFRGQLRTGRNFARTYALHEAVDDVLIQLSALNNLSHG